MISSSSNQPRMNNDHSHSTNQHSTTQATISNKNHIINANGNAMKRERSQSCINQMHISNSNAINIHAQIIDSIYIIIYIQ